MSLVFRGESRRAHDPGPVAQMRRYDRSTELEVGEELLRTPADPSADDDQVRAEKEFQG